MGQSQGQRRAVSGGPCPICPDFGGPTPIPGSSAAVPDEGDIPLLVQCLSRGVGSGERSAKQLQRRS